MSSKDEKAGTQLLVRRLRNPKSRHHAVPTWHLVLESEAASGAEVVSGCCATCAFLPRRLTIQHDTTTPHPIMISTASTINKTTHPFTASSSSSKRSVCRSPDATSAVVVASSPVSILLLPSAAGAE